jgi:hypothetical protein
MIKIVGSLLSLIELSPNPVRLSIEIDPLFSGVAVGAISGSWIILRMFFFFFFFLPLRVEML